ncbi:MAG: 2TM domain-containing protein [Acidimicrobiales bacterium]
MTQLIGATPSESQAAPPAPDEAERSLAIKQIQRRRKVVGDAVAYVAINAFLVVVWAMTGRGYFWPGWVLSGWGLMLLLDVWNAYYRRPITQEDIERELRGRR